MVSHPETGSDSPIGSNRDRGRDTTRKNPHYAINRGSLTEEAKVWF